MKEQLDEVADAVATLAERVGDFIYDALATQTHGGDEAEGAKELERQLARVRRSLAKAEQILRDVAGS